MLQPLHNLFALAGVALMLCALLSALLGRGTASPRWVKWVVLMFFLVLWFPVGPAQIPLSGYVRGVSSDLSITLVLLACAVLLRQVLPPVRLVEEISVLVTVLLAALLLYPMALGLGDWDPYRLGWGHAGMWVGLLVLVLACWAAGLRWLPMLVASALGAWSAGLMESRNLWDYLLDPWLTLAALVYATKLIFRAVLARTRWSRQDEARSAIG